MENELANKLSGASLMDDRELILDRWITEVLSSSDFKRVPLAGDASFRRYYRILHKGKPYVVMDAPPPEVPKQFVDLAFALDSHGLTVPKILSQALEHGFLLLSDFGDRLYLHELNATTADTLYKDAFQALIHLQTCPVTTLPVFDRLFLQRQLGIFEEWYLKTHNCIEVTDTLQRQLIELYEPLFQTIEMQPFVFVHRDYHSRNLMILDNNNPGIIDFQDAMVGPITYDLVSLLQDCYISWPRDRVSDWVAEYQSAAVKKDLLSSDITAQEFLRWFDWTGLQRHLKNLGIFSRLYHRDNKSGYLKDIPLLLKYIQETCQRYPELAALEAFFATLPEKAVV